MGRVLTNLDEDHQRLRMMATEYGNMIARMIERARSSVQEDARDWGLAQGLAVEDIEKEVDGLLTIVEQTISAQVSQRSSNLAWP